MIATLYEFVLIDEDPCQGNDVNSDCPNSTEQPAAGTSEPTEESTTQEPTEESTTNLPTEEPTVACTCPRCDVRSTCTANTFKRNGYTFGEPKTFSLNAYLCLH